MEASKAKQRQSYPLRLSPEIREQVRQHAYENFRSMNSELCVLVHEALNARKAHRDQQKKSQNGQMQEG